MKPPAIWYPEGSGATVFWEARFYEQVIVKGLAPSAVLVLILSMAVLLASCEDEDQSAVPPGAVSTLATAAAGNGDQEESTEESQWMLDAQIFEAPLPYSERIYFAHGGDIWQIPTGEDPAPVAEDQELIGYSPSAIGHRLALLRVERDSDGNAERTILSLVLPDGEVILDLSELDDDVDLDQMSQISSVSLNPAGDTLAMTHQNGAMTMATLGGEVHQLIDPATERDPGRLTWSSDGRFIAYLDPWMPDQASALYVVMPQTGVRQVLVEPSSDGHGVVQAEWIPGTPYLVYVKSSGSTIAHGGDVFLVNATTGESELMMPSGEIAPVAGVVELATAPDGSAIAVTGFGPGDERPEFRGLWLIDLQSGLRTEIEVESGETVTDIWWLGERLLFRTIDEPRTRLPGIYTGQEDFRLLEYDPGSREITERYASESE